MVLIFLKCYNKVRLGSYVVLRYESGLILLKKQKSGTAGGFFHIKY